MSTASNASTDPEPPASADDAQTAAPASPDAAVSGPGKGEDARYASQAAVAQPAPVAFEGGAAEPDSDHGTTGRSEWLFLSLAVLFSLILVGIPAFFFTGIDLTTPPDAESDGPPEGSERAREIERLQLLQETRADALTKLNAYASTEDGAYRIPVERAMRLVELERPATAAASREVRIPETRTDSVLQSTRRP